MITPIFFTTSPKNTQKSVKSDNVSYRRSWALSSDKLDINFASQKSLQKGVFATVGMLENNPKWKNAITRQKPLSVKANDLRTDFERDYNRIMHSEGNDRMRYKAQSYVAVETHIFTKNAIQRLPENDMISTRSTHVAQVADISKRICKQLGLNADLAEAIALGHDLGHSPFGHEGEHVLKKITIENGLEPFWHEKNSLKMVDDLLTLENSSGRVRNLNLTYAVRDGIICHCGEVDQNGLKPRDEVLDLAKFQKAGLVQPYTWEGCVVKVSDKIAYLGRDIEDALKSGTLEQNDRKELKKIVKKHLPEFKEEVNNSSLINLFTKDLIENSTPESGIGLSKEVFAVMKDIKKFNYEHIYSSAKQKPEGIFFQEVLGTIFNEYDGLYKGDITPSVLNKPSNKDFKTWLTKYSQGQDRPKGSQNKTVYNLDDRQQYRQAVIDFMSGMTDKYAQKTYQKIKKEQKIEELSKLKNNQMTTALTGTYKEFRKARQDFAKEAITDFEAAKEAKSMEIKNIPVFSGFGLKMLVFYLKDRLTKKTLEQKILHQYAKLDKMKNNYLKEKK